MPSDDKKEDQQSSLDLTNPEIVQSDNSLPPLVPPQTTTPAQINQVNINQIPPKAWDRLSPEQIVALTSKILDQADRKDQRHFEIAKQQAGETAKNNRVSVLVGGVVALSGLATTAYLASTGNSVVAGTIGTFLATIIAVVVGRKLSD